MAKIEVDKIVRFLENEADTCLSPGCERCKAAREFAQMIVAGALKKNVPTTAGKGSYVPKAEHLLTEKFLTECKAEGLPHPADYVHGFISWAREEQILKRDWFEFFKIVLRKKKKTAAPQYRPLPENKPKMTQAERQAVISEVVNGKK